MIFMRQDASLVLPLYVSELRAAFLGVLFFSFVFSLIFFPFPLCSFYVFSFQLVQCSTLLGPGENYQSFINRPSLEKKEKEKNYGWFLVLFLLKGNLREASSINDDDNDVVSLWFCLFSTILSLSSIFFFNWFTLLLPMMIRVVRIWPIRRVLQPFSFLCVWNGWLLQGDSKQMK